jgi:hypothetical protein
MVDVKDVKHYVVMHLQQYFNGSYNLFISFKFSIKLFEVQQHKCMPVFG